MPCVPPPLQPCILIPASSESILAPGPAGAQEVPKLLDICALFGEANPDLVGNLVGDAFRLQPQLGSALTAASVALAKNLEAMRSKAAPHMSARAHTAPRRSVTSSRQRDIFALT